MTINELARTLADRGHALWYIRTTALDSLHGIRAPRAVLELGTDAELVELARALDQIEYPGFPMESARFTTDSGQRISISCHLEDAPPPPYMELDARVPVVGDKPQGLFFDEQSPGQALPAGTRPGSNCPPARAACEAARLIARYGYRPPPAIPVSGAAGLPKTVLRELLTDILSARAVGLALDWLHKTGFLTDAFPELSGLHAVSHHKDFHPEGDLWPHTMHALENAAGKSPVLSLAVLLHDIGKPEAVRYGGRERPFDGHADIGASLAIRFLKRLEYDSKTTATVGWLVRHHMMPAALEELPLFRSEPVLSSPDFPVLLDLYEADTAATFRPPESTQSARSFYQRWLKNSRNPWRNPDGSPRR
ncbi:MAG TPA: HD domain-containing protein [Spirochaetota bacterium]|nr:HD domain-containing protein [Spirochaetota bacterium]